MVCDPCLLLYRVRRPRGVDGAATAAFDLDGSGNCAGTGLEQQGVAFTTSDFFHCACSFSGPSRLALLAFGGVAMSSVLLVGACLGG